MLRRFGKRLVAGIGVLLAAAGPAAAAGTASGVAGTEDTGNPKQRGEFYVKVSTGLGLTDDSDLEVRQSDPSGDTNLTLHDVEWEDNSLSGPSARYTGVRIGYFFAGRPWLGLAFDFLHYKVFAEVQRDVRISGVNQGVAIDEVAPMETVVQRYDVANGVNLLPFTIIARHRGQRDERYTNGRVQLYGGLGVGPTLLYTQSSVHGRTRGGPYEFGNPVVQLVGGVQFHVSRSWDVFFESKYTRTEADGSIAGGSSSADLSSNHWTLGGGYHW